MSEFIRPQVQVEEINETSARVSVEPLERGYGEPIITWAKNCLLYTSDAAATPYV